MKFIHYSCTANVITEISAHSDRQSQHSLKIEGSFRLFECFIIVYHLTVFLPFGQSQHSLKIEGSFRLFECFIIFYHLTVFFTIWSEPTFFED